MLNSGYQKPVTEGWWLKGREIIKSGKTKMARKDSGNGKISIMDEWGKWGLGWSFNQNEDFMKTCKDKRISQLT